ncbi:MAG: threonylcarbamoyl-AMP synthase [Pegethrix bostrychoides GSE-TBD4-15B]|jgi:tRNA threonylcarbamoyl adenosine modification protein (Sua5/YciO/YrdC/YwlC family)|uniref:Threonylcarbamoyl-AMP synthase n=1 Tax=Pegethrix bostrychoides GSE-TBD4-15B TaxID=2839662 RepID=A0A951P7Q0_9CYAN|nr:threonylcarbamoyl-AMP synthase [Pegethrix bostrychoides GSE-TBD4-15B]
MATVYQLHSTNPQTYQVAQICKALQAGAVILYPTDTVYAIGCDLNSKSAIERLRRIKQLSNDKPLTFLCPSLSNIAAYAQVSDAAYRLIKRLIPGTYTFLLPATKLVPRLVMSPKRKTTGIRVPDHPISQALLNGLGNPIISTSAPSALATDTRLSAVELFDQLDKSVDLIIDDQSTVGYRVSTIIDLTAESPVVVRKGLGWEAVADLEFAEMDSG